LFLGFATLAIFCCFFEYTFPGMITFLSLVTHDLVSHP
jgi:hypothetical protein